MDFLQTSHVTTNTNAQGTTGVQFQIYPKQYVEGLLMRITQLEKQVGELVELVHMQEKKISDLEKTCGVYDGD